jgi:hypothetical protein
MPCLWRDFLGLNETGQYPVEGWWQDSRACGWVLASRVHTGGDMRQRTTAIRDHTSGYRWLSLAIGL